MKKHLCIYFITLLAATFVFSTTSCSKDDDGSADAKIVGTWNLGPVDVYFDNSFIETVDVDDESLIHSGVWRLSPQGYFVDFQYIFKNNGNGSSLGIEFKYEIRGTDVYINGEAADMSFKDGVLSITRIDDNVDGYETTNGREYGFEYHGTKHVIKCIAKYIKQ